MTQHAHASPKISALIVAAGRGTRAGGETPKQWRPLAGKRVIDWTIEQFTSHPLISEVCVVLYADDFDLLEGQSDLILAQGGATRSASVLNGLHALKEHAPDYVLIHDAARATLPIDVLNEMIACAQKGIAAAPGIAIVDALWRAKDGPLVDHSVARDMLFRAQTPQGFPYAQILKAHESTTLQGTDDVEIARAAGLDVHIVAGHEDNIKITYPSDFDRAESILKGRSNAMDIRLGNGYDVHKFTDGDHVILCGIKVPHDRALLGHSNADVAMHAITDAIYGALAEGDIGRHFPPSDPQWKGAPSDIFLKHAVELATSKGFEISNIDCTIVCEYPKIGPHAAAMQDNLAQIMGIPANKISVKATTSEGLGFTGRAEGIASIATTALVAK